ncbi:MAG TPA: SAM-dependent methyltransferase [Nannocystaceae bacterium]|nr:SAM-dependent methyltransferase [Nannocystaceae bacterium]
MSITDNDAASRTAIMVAAFRGRASAREGAICRDPWALALAGDDGNALADAFAQHFPAFELWMAVRTAYLDAHVEHWTAQGFTQIVLMGAGLDTRAARLARAGVRFFELDHPASQREKLARLAKLDRYPIDAATYVPCDFETDDFIERLVAHGFDRSAPAFIAWEGVVPYLTEPAIRATLRRIADGCEPRTVLVFDYIMKRIVERNRVSEDDERNMALLDELGEPARFGINDPLPMLYEEGFRHVRCVSFDEACLSLTGTYERTRMFRFQHLATASRTASSLL